MTEATPAHDELRYALLDHMEEAEADALLERLDTNLAPLMSACTSRVARQLTEFIGNWHIEYLGASKDGVEMTLWRRGWRRDETETRSYQLSHAVLWGDANVSDIRKVMDDAYDAAAQAEHERKQAAERARLDAQERAQFLRLKAKFEPGADG